METQFKGVVTNETPNREQDQKQQGQPSKDSNKEQDLNKGGAEKKGGQGESQTDQRKGGK